VASIQSLAFAPNGRTLVSTSVDGTVKSWDPYPTNKPSTLAESRAALWFSQNGTRLITENRDGRLHLWDTASHTDLGGIGPRLGEPLLNPRTISTDGRTLALGSTNGAIKLWNLQTEQCERALKADEVPITYLACSRASDRLAAASHQLVRTGWQSTIRIWNTTSRDIERVFTNAFGPLAFAPDGRRLAYCRTDGSFVIWDFVSERPRADVRSHSCGCCVLLFPTMVNSSPREGRRGGADLGGGFRPAGACVEG
jgi:WD40 repeat protein